MLGVEVDVSGAGGHITRVERKIQTVKERIQAHISHQLPFTLTTLGVAMLVLFCVSRLNYQTSGTGGSVESPRVAFSGRQVNEACESDCGVKLATCWLRKRKGKTGWWKWSRKTCLLTTIK